MVSENEKSTCFPLGEAGAFGVWGAAFADAEGAKGDFASAEARFRACGHDQRTEPVWRLCARPLETFARSLFTLYGNPTLAGRGGSVSRRDHNQLARNRAPTRMGAQVRRKAQAYSQLLFGRGGLGERRFSQRSGLSPRIPAYPVSSGGSAREGLLLEKPPPSQHSAFHIQKAYRLLGTL